MRAIRTTLKIAPKTKDDEYERRHDALKDMHSAINSYKSSMDKVQKYVKQAVESLTSMKSVFDKMTGSPETPDTVRDLVLQYGVTVDRISSDYLAQFTQSMDGEVIAGANEIKKMYDECSQVESDRNKVMKEYDVYRNEVEKKESEYARKSKDLSNSKSYGSDLAKRNALKEKFDEIDQKFKDSHDYLVRTSASTFSGCMSAFFSCSSQFTQALAQEFTALHNSAGNAQESFPQNNFASGDE